VGKILPIDLYVLLHCYIFGDPLSDYDSESTQRAIKYFLDEDMIILTKPGVKGVPSSYSATQKGHVFVEMLRDTPFPVISWKDPRIIES